MTQPLVLITGATGHIGFRTLVHALDSGYRTRITVRKAAQIEKIKATRSIGPFADRLEYLEVPDITIPGAFDAAIKDVEFVLHIASPLPDLGNVANIDVQRDFLDPARQGTLSILDSAYKSPSVKRVVITSSVVILAPAPGTFVLEPNLLAPVPEVEQIKADPWAAYRASKILAHHAAQEWMVQHKPSWDLIYVLPAYTQGQNELVTELEHVGDGSNDIMIHIATGRQDDKPAPSMLVSVNDVAKLHIAALNTSKGRSGDRYIAAYPELLSWSQVPPIIQKLFPDAVRKGHVSVDGRQRSHELTANSSLSSEVFGIEFEGLESMVKSLVGQYIELLHH